MLYLTAELISDSDKKKLKKLFIKKSEQTEEIILKEAKISNEENLEINKIPDNHEFAKDL